MVICSGKSVGAIPEVPGGTPSHWRTGIVDDVEYRLSLTGYSPGDEPNTLTVERDRHALIRQANPVFRRRPDLTSLDDELFELVVSVVRVVMEQHQIPSACFGGELHCVGEPRMSPANVCTVLV